MAAAAPLSILTMVEADSRADAMRMARELAQMSTEELGAAVAPLLGEEDVAFFVIEAYEAGRGWQDDVELLEAAWTVALSEHNVREAAGGGGVRG